AEREPDEESIPRTKQEAQVNLIHRAFGGDAGMGRGHRHEAGVRYLFRDHHILVRDEYVDQVLAMPGGFVRVGRLIRGVPLLRVEEDTLTAVDQVNGRFGAGAAAPDHVVSISPEGAHCPATEPEVVPCCAVPDPGPTSDHAAGEGIRVVVVDTGLDP